MMRTSLALGYDPETALVRGMIDSDPFAWEEFRRRHHARILRNIETVTRRFPAASRDVAPRVYAYVLMSLLWDHKRMLRRFAARPGLGLSSWIELVTVHSTYEYLRAVATLN